MVQVISLSSEKRYHFDITFECKEIDVSILLLSTLKYFKVSVVHYLPLRFCQLEFFPDVFPLVTLKYFKVLLGYFLSG